MKLDFSFESPVSDNSHRVMEGLISSRRAVLGGGLACLAGGILASPRTSLASGAAAAKAKAIARPNRTKCQKLQ